MNNTLKPKIAPVEFEDEAFVIDDEININDVVPKGKNLCIFIFLFFSLSHYIYYLIKHQRFVFRYQQKN